MNKEEYAKALGKKIKARRLELEMSQEDLGKILNVVFTQISRIENGNTSISVLTLNKIALALKTKPAQLLP